MLLFPENVRGKRFLLSSAFALLLVSNNFSSMSFKIHSNHVSPFEELIQQKGEFISLYLDFHSTIFQETET